MTNSTLYNEKLVILNRLIKESTLTLEEAVLSGGANTASVTIKESELFTLT